MADRDRPWVMRTYSGHSSPKASNELYKKNLAKGQTGLSVAFDLPTQTGYDSDPPLAKGEVGRTGVPICHIGDMRSLFDGIGLVDEEIPGGYGEDYDWMIRAAEHGRHIVGARFVEAGAGGQNGG